MPVCVCESTCDCSHRFPCYLLMWKPLQLTYIRYCAFHAFTIVHLTVFASCVHPLNCSFEEYTESIQEFIGIQGLHFCPRSQTNLMTQTLLPSVFYIFAGTDCLYFFCFMCFCYRTFFIIELLWREYSLNVIFWFGFYHIVPIYMYW